MPEDSDQLPEENHVPFVPPEPAELERMLPQYAIQRLIASGGMGAVYAGLQRDLDRPVAIKILPPDAGRDGESIDRFRTEAKAMARLIHPHIPAVFEFAVVEEYCVLVMELVDGSNVFHLIRENLLPSRRAIEVFQQVCDAVHFAHSRSIVHGDIKPGNILVNTDGQAKLADFGLARLMEQSDRDSSSWTPMGTPEYAAPELYDRNATPDHRADIYSLGVVLHEMLTGAAPSGEFELPATALKLDPRIDEIIARCMEINPDLRYQSVAEIRQVTREILDGINAPPPAPPQRAASRKITLAQRKAPTGARKPATAPSKAAPPKSAPPKSAPPKAPASLTPVRKPAAPPPIAPPRQLAAAPAPAPTGSTATQAPPTATPAAPPSRRPKSSGLSDTALRNLLIGTAAVLVGVAAWMLTRQRQQPSTTPSPDSNYSPAPGSSNPPANPKPTEKPKDAPKESPKDKPTDKPAEKPKESPKDKPADPPKDKPKDAPKDKPTEKPTEKPADKPADKPTEKPADPPESVSGGLAALRLQFQRLWLEGPGAKLSAEADRLATPYKNALQKLDDDFIAKSDATSALAVRAERDRFEKQRRGLPSDALSKVEKLAALQKTLNAQLDKFSASLKPEADALREKYLLALTSLEDQLKDDDNADAAKEAAAEFSKATATKDSASLFRSP
jgi:serine/threonine protein kinase